MSEPDIAGALSGLRPDDLRIDEQGRVVITAPSVVEQLKNAGLSRDQLEALRNDTNIICCGNSRCGRASDLGSVVERLVGGNPT